MVITSPSSLRRARSQRAVVTKGTSQAGWRWTGLLQDGALIAAGKGLSSLADSEDGAPGCCPLGAAATCSCCADPLARYARPVAQANRTGGLPLKLAISMLRTVHNMPGLLPSATHATGLGHVFSEEQRIGSLQKFHVASLCLPRTRCSVAGSCDAAPSLAASRSLLAPGWLSQTDVMGVGAAPPGEVLWGEKRHSGVAPAVNLKAILPSAAWCRRQGSASLLRMMCDRDY